VIDFNENDLSLRLDIELIDTWYDDPTLTRYHKYIVESGVKHHKAFWIQLYFEDKRRCHYIKEKNYIHTYKLHDFWKFGL
jgi:hypothetical protein